MVYIQADGSLAAGMLYLRGGPEHRDDHWMMGRLVAKRLRKLFEE